MRLALLCALLATACSVDERDRPLFPGGPGLGSSGDGVLQDAAVDVDASVFLVDFEVCHAPDYRNPGICVGIAQRGIANLPLYVEESDQRLTHFFDEPESIILPEREEATFIVYPDERSATLERRPLASSMRLTHLFPLEGRRLTDPIDLEGIEDSATIALYIQDATGTPIAGASVRPPVGTRFAPFYAGPRDRFDWARDRVTDESGAVLLFGVPASSGTASIEIRTADGRSVAVDDIPVRLDTTTFHTAHLPN